MMQNLVWPMAAALLLLGAVAVVSPKLASGWFGIWNDSAWVKVAGVRDIFLGLAFILAHLHGSRLLVGELCLAAVVVPVIDVWVTRQAGAHKHSLIHFSGALGMFAFGCILIFTGW